MRLTGTRALLFQIARVGNKLAQEPKPLGARLFENVVVGLKTIRTHGRDCTGAARESKGQDPRSTQPLTTATQSRTKWAAARAG